MDNISGFRSTAVTLDNEFTTFFMLRVRYHTL